MPRLRSDLHRCVLGIYPFSLVSKNSSFTNIIVFSNEFLFCQSNATANKSLLISNFSTRFEFMFAKQAAADILRLACSLPSNPRLRLHLPAGSKMLNSKTFPREQMRSNSCRQIPASVCITERLGRSRCLTGWKPRHGEMERGYCRNQVYSSSQESAGVRHYGLGV